MAAETLGFAGADVLDVTRATGTGWVVLSVEAAVGSTVPASVVVCSVADVSGDLSLQLWMYLPWLLS